MIQYIKRIAKAVLNKPIVEKATEQAIYNPSQEYVVITSEKGRFEEKVVLITGASGWLGSAVSKRFAVEGAIVYPAARNKDKLEVLTKDIRNSQGIATPIIIDVTDNQSIENAVSQIIHEQGHIDVLVNCAGGSTREKAKNLYDQDVELIDKMLNVNLRGSLLCTRAVGKYMIEQKRGRIINISSVIGEQGKAKYSDYAAAKAGIIGYTKSSAQEFGPYGVTVNAVSPGFIQRGVFDNQKLNYLLGSNYLNTVGTAEDIAAAVAFLASDDARFITGQNLRVDGGRSLGLHGG